MEQSREVKQIIAMPNAAWQEFRSTLPLDNGLLAAAIAAGEPPEHAEILSLAAAVQAIYLSVTLEARELGRIDACYALWHETAGLFTDLCSAWTREPATQTQTSSGSKAASSISSLWRSTGLSSMRSAKPTAANLRKSKT